MLVIAVIACALGVALLRLGWRRRRDAVVAGWALLAIGLVALAVQAGAWGVAVGSLAATLSAAVALGHAALATAPGRAAPGRAPPSIRLPRPTLRDVGRRLGVFAAIVPAAMIVSGFLALAGYRATRVPLGETNATVIAIAVVPFAWTLLISVQLTRATLAAMLPPLFATAALGGLVWIAA